MSGCYELLLDFCVLSPHFGIMSHNERTAGFVFEILNS